MAGKGREGRKGRNGREGWEGRGGMGGKGGMGGREGREGPRQRTVSAFMDADVSTDMHSSFAWHGPPTLVFSCRNAATQSAVGIPRDRHGGPSSASKLAARACLPDPRWRGLVEDADRRDHAHLVEEAEVLRFLY